MSGVQRPFYNDMNIRYFLRHALNITENLDGITEKICDQEAIIRAIRSDETTLDNKEYRREEWATQPKREELREKIIEEVLSKQYINERNVKYYGPGGCGGCLPNTEIKKESKIFILIGLPASGKSAISENLAELTGSIYLDSDIIKRKFPEYSNSARSASLTHDESKYLTFPDPSKAKNKANLFLQCAAQKINMVYPIVGSKYTDLVDVIKNIESDFLYEVYVILIELRREEATKRCYLRYYNNGKYDGRYLPLTMVFDTYADSPTITYYKLLENDVISRFAHISTDVEINQDYEFKGKKSFDFDISDIVKKVI